MSQQSHNQQSEHDVSIKEILDFLVGSWKTLVAAGTIGVLVAAVHSETKSNIHIVTANIQVAKVADISVETPEILIEKLKTPVYFTTKTYLACNLSDSIEPGEVLSRKLKPTLSKNTPIVNLVYGAESRQVAERCLQAVFEEIKANQELIAKPIFNSKVAYLNKLKQELRSAETSIKNLSSKNYSAELSNSELLATNLLFSTILMMENRISELNSKIDLLEFSLTPPQTRNAFLSVPLYAPQQKDSTRQPVNLILGLIGGLFFGILIIYSRRAYQHYNDTGP